MSTQNTNARIVRRILVAIAGNAPGKTYTELRAGNKLIDLKIKGFRLIKLTIVLKDIRNALVEKPLPRILSSEVAAAGTVRGVVRFFLLRVLAFDTTDAVADALIVTAQALKS